MKRIKEAPGLFKVNFKLSTDLKTWTDMEEIDLTDTETEVSIIKSLCGGGFNLILKVVIDNVILEMILSSILTLIQNLILNLILNLIFSSVLILTLILNLIIKFIPNLTIYLILS